MEMSETNLFFQFLRISIGTNNGVNVPLDNEQWKVLFKQAQEQALCGVLFQGIEELYEKGIICPNEIRYKWMGTLFQIEEKNKLLDERTKELTERFSKAGLRSCVLKGQGVAQLYPQPHRRQCGDIDLWVEGGRRKVLNYLKNNNLKTGSVVIHHVDTEMFTDAETEIHFMPIWLHNPLNNGRLQQFFKKQEKIQFSQYHEDIGFSYPTGLFNAVYSLVHIFHHLLEEGVGMRQLVDYFYILTHLTEDERNEARKVISQIGLEHFAGAVMYVLENDCGMDKKFEICHPQRDVGQFLKKEIMISGNFGKHDVRYTSMADKSFYKRNKQKLMRQIHFLQYYPAEVLSIPFWKIWHWCWRKYKGYI